MLQSGLENLLNARENYLRKVIKLVKKIEFNPKYEFILKEPHFLYLAKWMKRSTHPDKPNLKTVNKSTAKIQNQILEDLVYELRSYVVEFVHESNLKTMILNSLDEDLAIKNINLSFKPRSLLNSYSCELIF
jgi:hypothetical protein